MPDVTCSRCWLWQPLGRSTTCRACGAPLITPTGLRVDQAGYPPAAPVDPRAAPAATSPGAFIAPLPLAHAPYGLGARVGYAAETAGTDWVLWVRVAIAVRQVTLPATAGSVPQTIDLGPAILVVVVVLVAITALIVWLAKFAVMRAVLLFLTGLGVVSVLSRMGAVPPADRIAFLADLGWDIVYGALLILSLASPRPQPR